MAYTKKEDTGKRRPDTRFHVFAEQWLWGSTRSELLHDERGILVDLLALAAFKGGTFEIFSREQTASQLCASVELLNRTLEKCVKHGKLSKIYKKREKKEIFSFKNWERYQPHYLHSRPEKHWQKKRCAKDIKSDASHSPINKTKQNKTELNKTQDNDAGFIQTLSNRYEEETGLRSEHETVKRLLEKILKDGEERTTIVGTIQGYFNYLDEQKAKGFEQAPKELHNFLFAYEDMKKKYYGYKYEPDT